MRFFYPRYVNLMYHDMNKMKNEFEATLSPCACVIDVYLANQNECSLYYTEYKTRSEMIQFR